MSRRVRFILWQLNRAEQRRLSEEQRSVASDEADVTLIGRVPEWMQTKLRHKEA
jgi:hypothetical protein